MTGRTPRPTSLRITALLALALCLTASPAFADTDASSFTADVRSAAEAQARHLLLQQRHDAGQIDSSDFAREDKRARAEVAALRTKYARMGGDYPRRFDQELARATQLAAGDPATPETALALNDSNPGGTTPEDYKRDVSRVAVLGRRRDELAERHRAKAISDDAYRAADDPVFAELAAISRKWNATGKGDQFNRDVNAFQKLLPPPARQPGEDEYAYDVRVAAYLNAILASLNQRYFSTFVPKGRADILLMQETDAKRREELQALRQKWQARGKGGFFDADYQRGIRTPPALPQEHWWQFVELREAMQGKLWLLLPVGFVGLFVLLVIFGRGQPADRDRSTVFGSAHYAPLEADLRRPDSLARGIFLGKSSAPALKAAPLNAPGAPVCSTPEHHTLILAPTRTGKGTRVIVPTLLRYDGSALVIDPKGENAAITAAIRRDQLRQHIHILNPWNALAEIYQQRGFTRATYNPLDILDRNDPNAVAVAQTLARAICPPSSAGKDPFWQNKAGSILTAVLLWLAYTPTEKKTLARVREIVALPRTEFIKNFVVPMAASGGFDGAIRENAAEFIGLAPETYSGVMANVTESTSFLSDPQIKAATAESSFSMDDLATGGTTVYVVLPPERIGTQRVWLRLVISSAMHVFKNLPLSQLGSGHRCLFLIDEFPALGRLDDVPKDIATMSGFGVDFALIIQGLDQLKSQYGEDHNTILSNCDYKWFCNVNDLASAKYLSDTLGKATVGTTSTSESSSTGHGGGSSSSSVSHGETGRLLLNPDEVLNLGREVAIAIQPDGHPHYLRPVDYWNLPEAFSALRQKYPFLYWDPELAYDDNPYFAQSRRKSEQKSTLRFTLGKRKPGAESDVVAIWPATHESGAKFKANGPLSEEQARAILGVNANATADEIMVAYKLLTKRAFHRREGGPKYSFSQLYAARKRLLGK